MPRTKTSPVSSSKVRDSETVTDRNTQANLLKDEYVMLQNLYEDFDSKGLTIKGWSITVALAIIGTGLLAQKDILLLVAFFTSLVFWYLEAYWRGLAHFFSVRIQNIEKAFRAETWKDEVPLQLYSTWSEEYDKEGDQTGKHIFKQYTILPHIAIAAVSLLLYILSKLGTI